MSYNDKKEQAIEKKLNLKWYTNFNVESIKKYEKALKQSKAVGKIVDKAYNRVGIVSCDEKAMYFKNGVEISKFMYAFNHPEDEIIDLSEVPTDELLNEINRRLNKELL